jgi:L-asparaginase
MTTTCPLLEVLSASPTNIKSSLYLPLLLQPRIEAIGSIVVLFSTMSTPDVSDPLVEPRIIIHGGAGNIRRENLPKESYDAYRDSLLAVLNSASCLLSCPDAKALDVAAHAVALLEDNPLFNCGKGAVFTRAGTTELEASIMVSNGYRKRGVGCMTLKRIKNPIKLAREMLLRGEREDGGGAQGHCQLSGEYLEKLAENWGMDIVEPEYFFTQRRWDEHKRGLEKGANINTQERFLYRGTIRRNQSFQPELEWDSRPNRAHAIRDPKPQRCPRLHHNDNNAFDFPSHVEDTYDDPSWDGHEYLPQGTVGAVVLDRFGTVCAATSTGGLTNKLPGRIGDTPTLGAGFWAEEWSEDVPEPVEEEWELVRLEDAAEQGDAKSKLSTKQIRHAIGMSGTGNGDSFLRTNAVRSAGAMSRFSMANIPLAAAVSRIAGPGGELVKSAGDRWGKTGEGEGGIIGIELVGTKSSVVWDFNCGGMFRAWIDDVGKHKFMVFTEDNERSNLFLQEHASLDVSEQLQFWL